MGLPHSIEGREAVTVVPITHTRPANADLMRSDDGARMILVAFFCSSTVLVGPQVRIADHQTGARYR
jgi:hypothetical protein